MFSDAFFMQHAIDAAWNYQLLTYPNPAVGCAITDKHGALIALAAHQKAGGPHAEVLALQQAYARLSGDTSIEALTESRDIHDALCCHHRNLFHDCTVYVTLEPCAHEGKTPPCALLLTEMKPARVVIAHKDSTAAGGGALSLEQAGIAVTWDVLALEAGDLLAPFLAWQAGKSFNVFKYAMHANGTIDGGIVSGTASRTHVHRIRSVIEALVIGGGTVRSDNPILDARLINGNAPDVRILSHGTINPQSALCQVPHRSVTVCNTPEALFEKGLYLIEGGSAMFEAVASWVDWVMVYMTPHMRKGATIQALFEGRIMHVMPMGEDRLIWIKKESRE